MNTAQHLQTVQSQPGIGLWSSRLGVGLAFLFLGAVSVLKVAAGDARRTNEPAVVHFGFSRTMFADVNENDAKAAVKVYSRMIGDKNGIDTGNGPLLLNGTNAIARALQLNQVDMIVLTAAEFFALEDQGLVGPVMLSRVNKTFTEEYVLLARTDSDIQKVGDLKGRSLIVLNDVRGSLASTWLEVLCREQGLGPADQMLARITFVSKPSQVVLPVFFGKADTCIVTRNGWELMGELNPQVKRQLRSIAMSPAVVPALTCFRRGLSETLKQRVIIAAEKSFANPSFTELMELFKTDDLCHQPVSALEGTRQFMATYHQLCAGMNPATAPETIQPPAAAQP